MRKLTLLYLLTFLFESVTTDEKIECGSHFTLKHGNVDFDGRTTTVNATVRVNCDDGYYIEGDPFITCLPDGTWHNSVICRIQDCGSNVHIPDGAVSFEGQATTYNQKARVICNTGYEISGPDSITCLSDGTWSTTTSCKLVDCGSNVHIPNGAASFEGHSTTYSQKARVICNTGYELRGPDLITCLSDGTWSTTTSCKVVDCGSNVHIPNGAASFEGQATTYSQKVRVICNTGYELSGPDLVTCLSDGTWSTTTYCKVIDCGSNVHIPNGAVSFEGQATTYSQKVRVICNTGYELNGPDLITCLSDGTWSTTTSCKLIDCGRNYVLENGFVDFSGRQTTFRQSVSVTCNTGYEVLGRTFITCQSDGTWSKDTICQIKDCGSELSIPNGHVELTGKATTYNSRFLITCAPGYERVGEPYVVCLHHGSWSNNTPCHIKDCGKKYLLHNGFADFNGRETTYTQKVPIFCDAGYEMTGAHFITCQTDGTWSRGSACQIKDCGTYYSLPNGFVDFSRKETTFEQMIAVSCNIGYDIIGDHFITCTSDGTWTKDTFCQIKDCGKQYAVANGHVNFYGRETTYNQTVPISCHTGFEIKGKHHITCLSDGTWSHDAACQIKDCGKNYYLRNGIVDFNKKLTTYNQKVPVLCNNGYKLTGDDYITCRSDGTWSRNTDCKIKDCGAYYQLERGFVDFRGHKTTFKENVPVQCNIGYQLIGESFITCRADGTWSTKSSCQIKDCGKNYYLRNGVVDFNNKLTTYKQRIPVSCNDGYKLAGDDFITCRSDGTWSRNTGCQIRDCGAYYQLEHGFIDFRGHKTTFKENVPVQCNIGYQLIGAPFITCRADGTWSTKSSCQIKDCGTDASIANGYVEYIGRETTYKSSLLVVCDPGYEVVGDPYIVCLHHGSWSTGSSCRIKDCGKSYILDNGYVDFSGMETTFGQSVPVLCNPGYSITGNKSITCLSNGSWSRDSICQIKDCGSDLKIPNGHVKFEEGNTTFNSTILVICNDGYELRGPTEIICLHHGYWSNTSTCEIKDCGAMFTIENGLVNFTGWRTVFKSSVPVTCNDGYEIYGEPNITCLSNGTWSKTSTCRIKDCGDQYYLENGHVNFTQKKTTFGQSIPAFCKDGYQLYGDYQITCLSDGFWSNSTACLIKDCGSNHTVTNGQIQFFGRNTTYNETINVSCNEGYVIRGHSFITCLSSGTWSNTTTCVEKAPPTVMIISLAVAVFVFLTVAGGLIVLFLKRTGKICYVGKTEGPSFEQFDLEFKAWNEFRPRNVNLVDFPSYVKKMHLNSNLLFADGFRLLKEQSPSHSRSVAESEACRVKNRYSDILPFDHSRVKLISIDEDEGSDYINASYIPGYTSRREYIVAQGPLPSTKDDFWLMIWEQKVDIVVMLTRCEERGRPKCEQYWPVKVQEPVFAGDLIINMRSESVLSDHVIRIIEVTLGVKTQIVTHFHYLKWPDHGCPSGTWDLLNFITMIRQFRRPNSVGPMLIHCSAGVGRTGTYIAVDRLLQHIKEHDEVDVYSVILDMRNARCHMVQTEDQFIYVYECLRHFITKENDDEKQQLSASPYPSAAYSTHAFENTAFQQDDSNEHNFAS